MKAGQPIFKLDSSKQEAALETARRRIAEVDAAMEQAKVELEVADGKIQEAQGAYQQAVEELDNQARAQRRNASTVAQRDIEKLENVVNGRQGGVSVAIANKKSIETQISSLLPAQKASAEAALARGPGRTRQDGGSCHIDGMIEQFTLRKGDIVNPLMRPAGILIPSEAGRWGLIAGFGQIEAQVIKPGMIAEATCIGKPLTIIPMVVTEVQDLYRSRPNQAHGSAHRCTTGVATWNAHRLSRAAVSRVVLRVSHRAACASPMPTPTITICLPTRTSAPGGGCSFTSLTRSHWCTP